MILTTATNIVIVGGGIIGNAIAFYLSRKTKANILVIEQNMLFSGCTSLAGSLKDKTGFVCSR